jgi:hypothetical protein
MLFILVAVLVFFFLCNSCCTALILDFWLLLLFYIDRDGVGPSFFGLLSSSSSAIPH